jgi:hypothetical protein
VLRCREALIAAGLAIFVFVTMAAGPVARHAAEIAAVLRGVLAGLMVALAVTVVTLTCYAVSVRPVIRQQYRNPDDDLLPPPVQGDPGWVKVASVHRPAPAPPVPLPGSGNTRHSGVVDSGRQEDDQEAIR